MNICYQKQLHPVIECMGYLEHYANQFSFLHFLDNIEEKYHDAYANKASMAYLDAVKEEMGAYMDQHYPQAKFWFTNIPKSAIAPIKLFLSEYLDVHTSCYQTIFDHFDKIIETNPLAFLQVIVENYYPDEKKIIQYDERALIIKLDKVDIDDDIKWKLIQMHLHAPAILKELRALFSELIALYIAHLPEFEKYLKLYLNDLTEKGDSLYESFAKKHQISFTSKDREICLIPTVAYGNSFILHESYLQPQRSTLIFWGVDVLSTAFLMNDGTSSEFICSVLKTLSDRSKFEILCLLSKKRQAYGAEIAKEMKLTTATISYHMQALINTHLIGVEKINNRLYYRINEEKLKEFLRHIEQKILFP